ncbi:hypothetical protein LEP1GSC103_2140 [Leptospira borgpetersenii serovar Javanica str. UI 09931]|uniref:Uncharacterized protein n=5 Tax=Leptospira borgpetersenii TaxID=174 RepID=M3HKT3_LEPBO|nr:hypothetical protein LBBP_03642 [Leptospira borgpetersenii serovar Ballum]EKP12734.1 hypothetical protein LEP1GSC128_4016 [Leptospira borgpetersenii str. 200801926]EKQ93735.1 hypothetical protein LEP1GSC101_1643 [Leptospira borgpetersenii str. UI 09149]EKR00208.1 hypothetical protein LEP1GSC121_3697 [Leptospira borgpetersenii serovar Castellonis str. 200801910]EMF98269.1 hypothetical protein LEP1GSC123_1646 [Leptospira borgpetersenii str. 200701203]EMK13434.1 hypothetical protein LEP1GSC066
MGTPTFSLYYELLGPISFLRFWDKFLLLSNESYGVIYESRKILVNH